MDSLKNTDFEALTRRQKSVQMKGRLLALTHFQEGHSRTQIAKFLKVTRTSINKWTKSYLDNGLEGLQEKPRTDRLTEQQFNKLKKFVTESAIKEHGGHLQAQDIAIYIEQHFGVQYRQSNIYHILHDVGLG